MTRDANAVDACYIWGMTKHPKRPRDPNQLARLIVDLATGEAAPPPSDAEKDQSAVDLGRRGGLKGGRARAQKLAPQRRQEIAKKAAAKRWGSVSAREPEPSR